MNREIIAKFLRFKGYEVFEAENGSEALYIMGKEEDIDVVLLDVEMLVMNGIETVRNIRISGYPAIVIMLTGLGDEETMKKAAQNGADDFLTKPIDLALLLSKLIAVEKYKKFHEERAKTYHRNTRKIKKVGISIKGLIVADSFDAMVCKRVYKEPMPMEKAFEEIKNLSGVLYSPRVIDVFIQIKDKVFKYYEAYKSA